MSTTRKCLGPPIGEAVAAIARHAGDVLDQRRPTADEAVVERRLPDVGAPHQRDERKIGVAHFWYPSSAIASGEWVQSGSMRTRQLDVAGACKSSLMATRARVPTSRIIVPPLPSTIARWLSRSTTMLAAMTTSVGRSFHSSTTMAMA